MLYITQAQAGSILHRIFLICCLAAAWCCYSPQVVADLGHDFRFVRVNLSGLTLDESHIGAISVIEQDRHGFIWIGGENGIARYDGRGVKIYKHNMDDPSSISDNRVLDIVFDHDNIMWVATGRGLNRYNEDTDSFTALITDNGDDNWLISNYITQLIVANDNSLILGTGAGLNIFSPDRTTFQTFSLESLKSNEVLSLCLDHNNILWMGTAGALAFMDMGSKQFSHFEEASGSSEVNDIYSLFEDSRGNLWIGSLGGGISRLDPQRQSIEHFTDYPDELNRGVVSSFAEFANGDIVVAYDGRGLLYYELHKDRFSFIRHDASDVNSVSSNQLEDVFVDQQQNLWLGSFTGEINILSRTNSVFKNYINRLVNRSVLAMEQTQDGYIWIGTEGGLNRLDPNTEEIKAYTPDVENPNSLKAKPVLALQKDKKDNLWVGTWGGGLHYFNRQTETFHRFLADRQITSSNSAKSPTYSLNNKYIWNLHMDANQKLWIGTQRGGLRSYDDMTRTFAQFLADQNNPRTLTWNFVRDIVHTPDNNLWVGTVSGLNFFNTATLETTQYFNVQENPTSLSAEGAIALLMHSNGDLWVGTEGGGINILKNGTSYFERINQKHGLPSMTVSTMVEDSDGYVWAGTLNGMAKLHPRQRNDITVFKTQDGLATNFFNRDASLLTQQGEIYIGGVGGLSAFNPKTLKRYQPQVDIVITDFKINHTSVPAGRAPLATAPHLVDEITLNATQNAFTFQFALLDYSGSAFNEYAYRLVGYDDEWNYAGRENRANYTNLNSGRYTFEVKGVSTDKQWATDNKTIEITILPPLWRTWWAYVAYVILIALGLYFIYITQYHRIELQKQTELNKNLVELDNLKDSFLANTTHELRTPLNGIIGIAEYLIGAVSGGRQPDDLLHKLEIISLSGKRLSNLVNDILDCSKLQANKLDLIKTDFSLYDAVDTVFHIVKYLVAGKSITLINDVPKDFPLIYADENRIQQIFFNLVSNAIKFTDKGSITIAAVEKKKHFEISVIDTGIGVEKENIEKMFIPYSQIASAGIRRRGGTGLGIPLTKALIDLHNGELNVESKVGKGSTFTFTLPKYSLHTGDDVRRSVTISYIDGSGYMVLVVDDDMVNRMILNQLLQKMHFTVVEAASGKEVLAAVKEQTFDMIIMDIHMPEQSGLETCEYLRKQVKLDIPILFLSGNSSQQDLKDCIAVGGQALIAKPISQEKLKNVLAKYIKKRKPNE